MKLLSNPLYSALGYGVFVCAVSVSLTFYIARLGDVAPLLGLCPGIQVRCEVRTNFPDPTPVLYHRVGATPDVGEGVGGRARRRGKNPQGSNTVKCIRQNRVRFVHTVHFGMSPCRLICRLTCGLTCLKKEQPRCT